MVREDFYKCLDNNTTNTKAQEHDQKREQEKPRNRLLAFLCLMFFHSLGFAC